MESWRPSGWKNPETRTVEDVNKSYPKGIPKGYHIAQEAGFHEGYEAGADAMLETLLNNGLRVNNMGDMPQGKGTIIFIFIPDKEGK